jgi:hypothetical protein
MEKGRWAEAFKASSRLRSHEIQSSRDMYYAAKLLEVEAAERQGKSLWKEFFGVRRNRRAAQSAFFVMFMQQVSSLAILHNTTSRLTYPSSVASMSSHTIAPTSLYLVDSRNPTPFLFLSARESSTGCSPSRRSTPSTLSDAVTCCSVVSLSWPSACSGAASVS